MQNTILARAQGAKSARAQGANFAWHLQSGLCFSCDIFHILSACACGLCADVTVRPLPGRVFLVMFLLNVRAVFMLQNLFGLGLA